MHAFRTIGIMSMRTKSLKKNKINVITLGCSKNTYDSEVLMGQLKASGKLPVAVGPGFKNGAGITQK